MGSNKHEDTVFTQQIAYETFKKNPDSDTLIIPEGYIEMAPGCLALPRRIDGKLCRITKVVVPSTMEVIHDGILLPLVEKDLKKEGINTIECIEVCRNNPRYSTKDGVLFTKDFSRLIAYAGKTKSWSYVVPDGVKVIGKGAFYDSRLGEVSLPESVRVIEEKAFYRCVDLWSLTLAEGVEIIQSDALARCDLGNLVLPASLKTIASSCLDSTFFIFFQGNNTKIEIDSIIEHNPYNGPVFLSDDNPGVGEFAEKNKYNYFDNAYIDEKKWVWSKKRDKLFSADSEYVELPDSVKYVYRYAPQDIHEQYILSKHEFSLIGYKRDCENELSEETGYSFFWDVGWFSEPEEIGTLTNEGVQEILEYREDRILVIPFGTVICEEEFALQFDQEDKNLHFFQIDIPPTVRKIELPLILSREKHIPRYAECFDEINVHEFGDCKSEMYCSVEGVLFSKDKKSLLCYPCGKRDKRYRIPEGVEEISPHAFLQNRFLEEVICPWSLKIIQGYAFEFCENLKKIEFQEGIEVIWIEAFSHCNIEFATLPTSLEMIHWSNLSGCFSGFDTLEILNSNLKVNMSGYDANMEREYGRPLLLIPDTDYWKKFASRHMKNYFTDYFCDGNGIIWSEEGTLVDFPSQWPELVYDVPENVKKVFRWAFNNTSVEHVISNHRIEIVGDTFNNDFCQFEAEDGEDGYKPNFLVIRDDLA